MSFSWQETGQDPPLLGGDRPHTGTAQYQVGQAHWLRAALANDTVTLVVGRDVGKTAAMLFLIEEESSLCDHFYEAAYIAQSHAEATKTFAAWLKRWQDSGLVAKGGKAHKDKDQDRWIVLVPWGQNKYGWRVHFWSGDSDALDNLRGARLDRICPDEAGFISPKIKRVVWPMGNSRQAKKFIAGTPSRAGCGFTWFKDFYDRGKKGMPGFVSFNAPSECAPWNMRDGGAYMRQQRLSFRDSHDLTVKTVEEREEFDGEFVTDYGSVFKNIDRVISLPILQVEEDGTLFVGREATRGHSHLFGQDWGRIHDNSVTTVFDREDRAMIALRIEPRGLDYDIQLNNLDRLYQRYPNGLIIGDGRDAGAYLGKDFLPKRYGVGYRDIMLANGGPNEKGKHVTRMRRLFTSEEWHLLDVPALREQFSNFQANPMGEHTSGLRYEAPSGEHDDIVMSCLFASTALELETSMVSRLPTRQTDPWSFEGVQEALRRQARMKRMSRVRIR